MKREPGVDADDDLKGGSEGAAAAPQVLGGATDIFATISSKDEVTVSKDEQRCGEGDATRLARPEAGTPLAPALVPAAAGPVATPPQPIVHGVVFKDDVSSSDGSDALMNLLRSSPPPSQKGAREGEAASLKPGVNGADGGFTQLLRALNFEQSKPAPGDASQSAPVSPAQAPRAAASAFVSPPVPVVAPGEAQSLTQMLQAMDSAAAAGPQAAALPAQEAAPSAGGLNTTGSVPAAAPEPGSFTQLFSTLETDRASVSSEATGKPVPGLAGIPSAETAMPSAPQSAPAASEPAAGASFTQMFQALGSPLPEPQVADARGAAPGRPSAPPTASESSTPGTFTQLFSTLGGAAAPSPAPPSLAGDPPRAQFGSSSSGVPGGDRPARLESAARTMDAAPALSSSPGSFTQLFRTLDEPGKVANPAISQPAPAQESPFPALPARQESHPSESGVGASQIFSTYSAPPEKKRADPPLPGSAGPGYGETVRPPASAPISEAAGLTQLLRLLDQPAPGVAQPVHSQREFPASAPSPGSFTSAYAALDSEGKGPASPFASKALVSPASPAMPPAAAPLPVAADASPAGPAPSEFTRILNASALREAGLRGGASGGSSIPPAAPQAPAAAAGALSLGALPHLPPAPHLPAMPQPAQPSQPPQAPHWAAPALPATPTVPPVKLPEVPAPAVTGSKMQQYLPLLLLIIIFLLVVILVTVIFLLKH